MKKEQEDFYQYLRHRIKEWAGSKEGQDNKWLEYVLLVPDFFHLLVKLSLDPGVPRPDKTKLALVIAYFISPVDLIPEIIFGPFGYIDDLALAAYALNNLINKTSPDLVVKYWSGDDDVLDAIQRIIYYADEMLGSGLWKKLRKRFFEE